MTDAATAAPEGQAAPTGNEPTAPIKAGPAAEAAPKQGLLDSDAPPPKQPAPAKLDTAPFGELSDDDRAYLEKKGFKTPGDALAAYRNLEKLRGVPEDRLLKIPGENATDEERAAYSAKLGVPASFDKYEVAEGVDLSDPVFKGFAEEAHKHNISSAAFKALQEKLIAIAAEGASGQVDRFQAAVETMQAQSPREFNAAKEALARVGAKQADLEAIGAANPQALMAFVAKMGGKLVEGQPALDGDDAGFGGSMEPKQADAEITRLRADKNFQDQYHHKDAKIRKAAIDKMARLFAAANPE